MDNKLTTMSHEVEVRVIGDSILAPLTGAEFRKGRESKAEFGLPEADSHTMGMNLLIQPRETDHPVSYTPPAWAYTFRTGVRNEVENRR